MTIEALHYGTLTVDDIKKHYDYLSNQDKIKIALEESGKLIEKTDKDTEDFESNFIDIISKNLSFDETHSLVKNLIGNFLINNSMDQIFDLESLSKWLTAHSKELTDKILQKSDDEVKSAEEQNKRVDAVSYFCSIVKTYDLADIIDYTEVFNVFNKAKNVYGVPPIYRIVENLVKEPSKEIEDLVSDAKCAYYYAHKVAKGRCENLEAIIAQNAECAYYYALVVIKGRWETSIPEIAETAERVISENSTYACEYARYVIKGRWKAAEKCISKEPYSAYNYARHVIKGRWKDAEKCLVESKDFFNYYVEFIESLVSDKQEYHKEKNKCYVELFDKVGIK
jgi:hypothetical protein